MKKKTFIVDTIKSNAGLILFIFGLAFFRTGVADWNYVPSGSMEPTLYEGDWVLVDKTTYGASLPFANIRLFSNGEPERGDVITFVPPHTDRLFVKRVIGLPGDAIRIEGRGISVNGEQLPFEVSDYDGKIETGRELVGNRDHSIQFSKGGQLPFFVDGIVVPEGKYFAVGDHRTHSADSRYWGFVDGDNIMGKVTRIALSISDKRKFTDGIFQRIN